MIVWIGWVPSIRKIYEKYRTNLDRLPYSDFTHCTGMFAMISLGKEES